MPLTSTRRASSIESFRSESAEMKSFSMTPILSHSDHPRTSHWMRPRPWLVLGCLLGAISLAGITPPASAADATPKRKVIIDQDAFGPAGSNLQAILLLLQAKDVEVLGITVPSGDGWRDENVSHALRLLEIAHRPEVPVVPGAVFPL